MTSGRRIDAIVAAAETLDALNINQGAVIDPFAAIADLGLELNITRLDNLLGAVLPQGDGGVVVTSERSPAIQRYTAAHEIGHWRLHGAHLQADGYAEVFEPPSNEIEREAQLFASYFLMPTPLLDRAVAARHLRRGQITPEDVYRLSRDLHVSYEAAARRLYAARLITNRELGQIRDVGRMTALQRASGGHRPADGLAEMWDASSDEDLVRLMIEEHDEVLVGMPEQRLAGWRWQTADQLAQRNDGQATPRPRPQAPSVTDASGDTVDPWLLSSEIEAALDPEVPSSELAPLDAVDIAPLDVPAAVVEDIFVGTDGPETPARRRQRRRRRTQAASATALDVVEASIGGDGLRTFVVRAAQPGEWTLQLYYAHAYDPRGEAILSYELQLQIHPRPNTAFRIQRLASDLDLRLPGDPDDDQEFEVEFA